MNNFLAPSEEEAEAGISADASDADANDPDPTDIPEGSRMQGSRLQPGSPALRRLRRALEDEDMAAPANGLAAPLEDSMEDSEPGSELPQHVIGQPELGHDSEAGYRRYTPEEKGKQKIVEGAGPSGLHGAQTPERLAEHPSEAGLTPGLTSSGGPATKRRRLRKANEQTLTVTPTPLHAVQ